MKQLKFKTSKQGINRPNESEAYKNAGKTLKGHRWIGKKMEDGGDVDDQTSIADNIKNIQSNVLNSYKANKIKNATNYLFNEQTDVQANYEEPTSIMDHVKEIQSQAKDEALSTATRDIARGIERNLLNDYSNDWNNKYTKKYDESKLKLKLKDTKYNRVNNVNVPIDLIHDVNKAADKVGVQRSRALALVGKESSFVNEHSNSAMSGWESFNDIKPLDENEYLVKKYPERVIKEYHGYRYDDKNFPRNTEQKLIDMKSYQEYAKKYHDNYKTQDIIPFEKELRQFKKSEQGYNPGQPDYIKKLNEMEEVVNENPKLLTLKQGGSVDTNGIEQKKPIVLYKLGGNANTSGGMEMFKQGGATKVPVEIEGGEPVVDPITNTIDYVAKGPSHEQGGIKTVLPTNKFIIPKNMAKQYQEGGYAEREQIEQFVANRQKSNEGMMKCGGKVLKLKKK